MRTDPMDFRKVAPFILFLCGVLGLTLAIAHALLPPFWGNPGLAKKVAFVEEADHPFDRLFIGSSHIYRQVSPHILDSMLRDGRRSFNLGFASTSAPEAELACEHLLNVKDLAARTIYVELSPLRLFKERHLKSARDWYMVSPHVWWDLVTHAWTMDRLPRKKRLEYVERANLALIKATFLPGLFDQYMEREVPLEQVVFGPQGDGFMSLDQEALLFPENTGFRSRRAELASDTMILHRRSERAKANFEQYSSSFLSRPHRDLLERLMKLGNQRGIKVVFILPPLSNSPELVSLYHSLPEDRRINLCDPRRFPEFYFTRNAFDRGHLNAEGSRFFTVELAKAIQRLGASRSQYGSTMEGTTGLNAIP